MTDAELRTQLEPIVLDQTLTKEERSAKLVLIAIAFMDETDIEGTFNRWNNIMAAIIIDNKLGHH